MDTHPSILSKEDLAKLEVRANIYGDDAHVLRAIVKEVITSHRNLQAALLNAVPFGRVD